MLSCGIPGRGWFISDLGPDVYKLNSRLKSAKLLYIPLKRVACIDTPALAEVHSYSYEMAWPFPLSYIYSNVQTKEHTIYFKQIILTLVSFPPGSSYLGLWCTFHFFFLNNHKYLWEMYTAFLLYIRLQFVLCTGYLHYFGFFLRYL